MGPFVRSHEIVQRLRLHLPLRVTLHDPWSGEPFTFERDNVLSLLVIDSASLPFEMQAIPALYAEAGRAARAAEYAADQAEVELRAWKAARGQELRTTAPEKITKAGKPAARQGPTAAEIEEFYWGHDEYAELAEVPARFRALAGLFGDLREAFALKQRLCHDQAVLQGAHELMAHRDDQYDRLREVEQVEEELAQVLSASGSHEAVAEYVRTAKKGKGSNAAT